MKKVNQSRMDANIYAGSIMLNMIDLCDKIRKKRKNQDKNDTLYRCSCDKCGADRGYLDKNRAKKLCRTCQGKISHSDVAASTKLKMSRAKLGKKPWNKGRKASLESRLKMSKAKMGKDPWNKLIKGKSSQDVKSKYRHLLRKAVFKNIVQDDFAPYLGCTAEYLRSHIETQFTERMSWSNYGIDGWHLDHIVPLKYFNLHDEEQLKIACNYKNVQPLYGRINLAKHKRIVYILTGAPGVGKSWICKNMNGRLDAIDVDIVRNKNIISSIKTSYRPVVAMSFGVSTFIKLNTDLDIRLVVIKEEERVIRQRLSNRGGKFNNTILRRIKRMESLSKKSYFTGTVSEVLYFLNNKAAF